MINKKVIALSLLFSGIGVFAMNGSGCRGGKCRGWGMGRCSQRGGAGCAYADGRQCRGYACADCQRGGMQKGQRALRRDGRGPRRDGRGPRETDLGPRPDCPNQR